MPQIITMTKKEIGQTIKQHLKNTGQSKYRVVKAGGIRYQQLTGIEQGKQNYTIDSLLLFLDRIGLEIAVKEKEKDSIL